MEIARERFLDESRLYHVTLNLRSRTTEMHSVMTALSNVEREAVGAALARALDEIQLVIAARLVSERERLAQPTTITS
jgi:hypothetical protein